MEVCESVYLCLTEQFAAEVVDISRILHSLVDVDDVLEFLQEPLVDFREFVNLVDGVALVHGFRDDEDALVGRFAQCRVDVWNLEFLIFHKSVHSLSYHSQSLLYGFLEVSSYSHHFSHRLH